MHGRFWKTIVFGPLFLAAAVICGALLVSSRPFEIVRDYVIFQAEGTGYLDEFLDAELHVNMPYVILPAVMGIPYVSFLYEETAGRRYQDSLIRSGGDRYVTRHISRCWTESRSGLPGTELKLEWHFTAGCASRRFFASGV